MPRDPKPWYRKDRDSWFVTIDGKRHKLGADKKEAFEKFYQMMNRQPQTQLLQPKRNTSREGGELQFAVVADLFLDWSQKHRSPDTYEWYRYRLERFCQTYPSLTFDQMKPHHVQRWVDSYPGFTQTSRRNYIRSVKRCSNWARRQGYVSVDPIESMEVPGSEARELSVSRLEFAKICAFIHDDAFLTLCKISFETGCRPQEVLRVQAEHFDEANQRWVLPPSKAKGKKKPRIVYLSPFALEATKANVAKYRRGHIFRNSRDRPWTTEAVNCAFDRLQTRMGKNAICMQGLDLGQLALNELKSLRGRRASWKEIPERDRYKIRDRIARSYATRYSLYAFRHSWATNALEAGIDALTVATLMGHSDPSTLARVYSHIAHNPGHMHSQALRAIGL